MYQKNPLVHNEPVEIPFTEPDPQLRCCFRTLRQWQSDEGV